MFQSSPITITKNSIESSTKQILERDAALKKIRIHDFKHSHASLLINRGERLFSCERKARTRFYNNYNRYLFSLVSKQAKRFS